MENHNAIFFEIIEKFFANKFTETTIGADSKHRECPEATEFKNERTENMYVLYRGKNVTSYWNYQTLISANDKGEIRKYEVHKDNVEFFKSLISNNDVYLFNVVENDEEESAIKRLLESNNFYSLGQDPFVFKN